MQSDPSSYVEIQLKTFDKDKEKKNDARNSNPKREGESIKQPQPQVPPEHAPQRLKSEGKMIFLGLIISLSAINLGYSMKEITSVPIDTLIQHYNITISSFSAQSILIGIMPIGAIVGVLVTIQVMKCIRRVTGIYIFTIVNCVGIALINVNMFGTLVSGRFIQGISIGFYATIAPIYLREMAPKELRRLLGLFFSLGKIIGVIYVILLEIFLRLAGVAIAYRIILSFTAVFSVIQVILIFCFGSNTPTEMMENGNTDEARAIIKQLYKPEYVEQIFKQYSNQYYAAFHQGEDPAKQAQDKNADKRQKQKSTSNLVEGNDALSLQVKNNKQSKNTNEAVQQNRSIQMTNKNEDSSILFDEEREQLTFQQKKSMLYCLGVHMCALRQYTGGNVLLVQGGLFISTFDKTLGRYTPLIINLVQFAAIIFGIVYLQKKIGKRPAFLFSLSMMSVLNFALVVSMIYEQILATMILMSIFMLVFGGSFINQNWAYPAEVVPAREATIPNIIHWFTMSTSNLIPPLISGAMPNNNPYPIFIFFGIYCFIGFVHVRAKLQQTDGFTYMEIVNSMK